MSDVNFTLVKEKFISFCNKKQLSTKNVFLIEKEIPIISTFITPHCNVQVLYSTGTCTYVKCMCSV